MAKSYFRYVPKGEKRRINPVLLALAVVLLAILAMQVALQFYAKSIMNEMLAAAEPVSAVDVRYEPTPVLYLTRGCLAVSFSITDDQAMSISQPLSGTNFVRPLTHDMMYELLKFFDVRLLASKVYDAGEPVPRATMLFVSGSRIYQMDARPSDAVALSLRTGSPVYIDKNMNATNVCR